MNTDSTGSVQKRAFAEESKIRQIALRAASASSVLLASLLLSLTIPFFPRELTIFISVGLGVLAYKAPTPALIIMLLLGIPGYFYQLSGTLPTGTGLPVQLVVMMFITILIVWVLASERGEPIGAAAGAIAFVLMLTPAYFLALPIIIGTAIFRVKGMKTRMASLVVTFVVLYYPFLAIGNGSPISGSVPIFEPVMLNTLPPISVLSLSDVIVSLGRVVDTSSTQSVTSYITNLANYWPLSPEQRLFPVGIIFCILSAAALAAAAGARAAFQWLANREVRAIYLPYAAAVVPLLMGVLVFILLTDILARPLAFASTLSILPLLVGTVIVGGSTFLAKAWLKARDGILDMREQLTGQIKTVREQNDSLRVKTGCTKAQCQRMETSVEEALDQICQQELAFAEQAVNEMSVRDLQEKRAFFQELQEKINAAVQESHDKLCRYYDQERQKYNDSLTLAETYGFHLGENLQGPDFSQLRTMEYDDVLNMQMGLNDLYRAAAESLAEGIGKLVHTLSTEVDPDFKRTGIHIARNYLAHAYYADALQDFLLELGDIEHFLTDHLAGLDQDVVAIVNNLKLIVADVLLPTAINLGDITNVKNYKLVIGEIIGLCGASIEEPKLPDLIRTVARVGQLAEIIATLSLSLAEKISELEKSIEDKTPAGYNWGVDTNIQNRLVEVSRNFHQPSGPVDIHDRLSLIKKGPSVLDAAAQAVKECSIAHELLINYSNIETLIEEKLRDAGSVVSDDLPVKRKYSRNYFQLYRLKHPGEVSIEEDTGRLIRPPEIRVMRQNVSLK